MDNKKKNLVNEAIIEEDEEGNVESLDNPGNNNHHGEHNIYSNTQKYKGLDLEQPIDLNRESNVGPPINTRFTTIDSGKFAEPTFKDNENPQEEPNLLTEPLNKHEFKVLLIGNATSGKSSIVKRFIENKFSIENNQNINPDNLKEQKKSVNIDSQNMANLSLIDTAGEETHSPIIPKTYFLDIHAALLVFDLTNKQSFDNIEHWIEEIGKNAPPDCVMMLAGNKSDLKEGRAVSVQEMVGLAQKNNIDSYEVSAKTGNNVALVFEMLATKILAKQQEPHQKVIRKEGRETLGLKEVNPEQIKVKKNCCS